MNEKSPDSSPARPSIAVRVLNWLRQGYPNGIPNHDTFALFYVLERELTEEDLRDLTELIIAEGESTTLRPAPITREQIGRLILKVHAQSPVEEDITRIRQALIDADFPVS